MPTCFDRAATVAKQSDRQIFVAVGVAVGNAAAVHDHTIVQQRALALVDRIKSFQEVPEQSRVEDVDLADLLLLVSRVAVM